MMSASPHNTGCQTSHWHMQRDMSGLRLNSFAEAMELDNVHLQVFATKGD